MKRYCSYFALILGLLFMSQSDLTAQGWSVGGGSSGAFYFNQSNETDSLSLVGIVSVYPVRFEGFVTYELLNLPILLYIGGQVENFIALSDISSFTFRNYWTINPGIGVGWYARNFRIYATEHVYFQGGRKGFDTKLAFNVDIFDGSAGLTFSLGYLISTYDLDYPVLSDRFTGDLNIPNFGLTVNFNFDGGNSARSGKGYRRYGRYAQNKNRREEKV